MFDVGIYFKLDHYSYTFKSDKAHSETPADVGAFL